MQPQSASEHGGSLGLTLGRHILLQQQRHPEYAAPLSILLHQMAFAGKVLSREIGRAALVGTLGLIGDKNPTGDSQKKLDVYSNDIVLEALAETGQVHSVLTEEMADIHVIPGADNAEYVVSMDPLDGSSNTDINGALGTIFAVFPRVKGQDLSASFLRPCREQVLAGYILYSTSTLLVYTMGRGVYGFTLDRDLGEFLLSHDNIRCPSHGKAYSANVAHSPEWSPNIQKYVEYLSARDAATNRPYSLRYSGALVGDVHRCLVEGGLYFYPSDPGHKQGKLRLLYECAPLGFIVEQAGGRASNGFQRILDIRAESIHQRMPLAIGSTEDVAQYDRFFVDGRV
jgi:fructose-1,6-bisphosphatase I